MDESNSEFISRSKVFSSEEFVEFLTRQANEITVLEVTTKSGDRISASFNAGRTEPPTSAKDDAFKSLDALRTFLSEDSTGTIPIESSVSTKTKSYGPGKDYLTSKDWSLDYAKSHVDVTYDRCFTDGRAKINRLPEALTQASSLPPKKRTGKTDWNAVYNSALSPLVEAAARAQPQPVQTTAVENYLSTLSSLRIPASSMVESNKKRKSRKIVPEKKEFVDTYTDQDVLFGRGGRSNHHIGNKLYRELVIAQQDFYRCCDKNEKTKVAQAIVDTVLIDQNGRFLERDSATGRYFIVPNLMARRKVGQALRENNTEEARAAKREKYGQQKMNNGEWVPGGNTDMHTATAVVPNAAMAPQPAAYTAAI